MMGHRGLALLALIFFISLGYGAEDISFDVVLNGLSTTENEFVPNSDVSGVNGVSKETTDVKKNTEKLDSEEVVFPEISEEVSEDTEEEEEEFLKDTEGEEEEFVEETEVEDEEEGKDFEVTQPGILVQTGAILSDDEKEYFHRMAPSISYSVYEQPYVITETRLKTIRSRLLYPFYDQGGDDNLGDYQGDIHSSTSQLNKNLNFQLPFYGFRFNYTRVSMHGYLEFSDPPPQYTYPLIFPVKGWPVENDPSFIGIFYSKCRIGAVRTEDIDQRKAGVYFRMERDLQERTDQAGVEMRERLMWDIKTGIVGASDFKPKHAAIVTWKNMSFAGGIDNALFKTNTFQMVLATDEIYTYAIFNYVNLQWTSHTEAGGDTTGGEGGVPAFIGFNAGNGTQSFEYMPYSQSSVIRDLTVRGYGNQIPGRHIFRIDERIILGACNKGIDGANLPLVFAPESGNMLGGNVVNITGPCFKPTDRVSCRFDTEYVVGFVVDTNRAICVQPLLMAEGYVRFEVAINTEKYKWKGKFFVETPATATEHIFFQTNDVHEKSPAQIKISWDAYNLTTNLNAGVQISVWGYRETKNKPELQFIDILEGGVQNKGEYTIDPGNYRLRDNNLTNDMQLGFIQINLTNSQENLISQVFWSKPIPLGWYFGPQWERSYGSEWPEKMCNNWLSSDRYFKNVAANHLPCPCTLEYALLDKGRFLPDFDCDKDTNPKCYYHKGAVQCVRGSPSLEGSGQQCCYDNIGYLVLSHDQQWGSRLHHQDILRFLPRNEANTVSVLLHWYHDQIPFHQCCLWQGEQAVGCDSYKSGSQPTQDCVMYQPPGVGTVFGDSHIVTFDNHTYTFTGKGEFVLARTDLPSLKLDVQGRFEHIPHNTYRPVNATQLTSVAAAGNSSTTIEVRLRSQHAQWRYRLDVFANGKRIYFDRNSLKIQHFPGVLVYTPTEVLNQSKVIMMFQSGAGVEVLENQGFMTVRVYLPQTYIGCYRIEQSMGKGKALFVREFGRTASYYNNVSFDLVYFKKLLDF